MRAHIVSDAQKAGLTPETVLGEMKKNGVTHVVWLPDSETNFMYQMLMAEPSLDLVPVCREGETMAIAAGLLSISGLLSPESRDQKAGKMSLS